MSVENQSNQINTLDQIKLSIFEHLDELEKDLIDWEKKLEDLWWMTFKKSFISEELNIQNSNLDIQVQITYLEDILEFIDTDFKNLTDAAKWEILKYLSSLSNIDLSREDQRTKMREMDAIRKSIRDITEQEKNLLKDSLLKNNVDDLMSSSLDYYNRWSSNYPQTSKKEINDIFAKAFLETKDLKWRESFKIWDFNKEGVFSLDCTKQDFYIILAKAIKHIDSNTLWYFYTGWIKVNLNDKSVVFNSEQYWEWIIFDEQYTHIIKDEIDRRNWDIYYTKAEFEVVEAVSYEVPKQEEIKIPTPSIKREAPENSTPQVQTISSNIEANGSIPSKREVLEVINNSKYIRIVIELLIRQELTGKEIWRREEDGWKIHFTSEYIDTHIDDFINNFIELIQLFWEIESSLNPQWRNGYNREWKRILKVWQKPSSAKGMWQYLTENGKWWKAYEYEFKRKWKDSVWRFLGAWEKRWENQARRLKKYWKTSSHETANNNVFDFAETVTDPSLKAILDWIAPNFIGEPTSWLDARKLTIEQQAIMFLIDLFKNPRSVKNANWDRVYIRDYLWLAATWNNWSQDMIYAIFHHTSPNDKWVRDNMSRWRNELNRLLWVENNIDKTQKETLELETEKTPDLVVSWGESTGKLLEKFFPNIYNKSNPGWKTTISYSPLPWDKLYVSQRKLEVKRWNEPIKTYEV